MTLTCNFYGLPVYFNNDGVWVFADTNKPTYINQKLMTMDLDTVGRLLKQDKNLVFSRKDYDYEDGSTNFNLCITSDELDNLIWLFEDEGKCEVAGEEYEVDTAFELDLEDLLAKDWYLIKNHPTKRKEDLIQFNEHIIEIKEVLECLKSLPSELPSECKKFVFELERLVGSYYKNKVNADLVSAYLELGKRLYMAR